MACVVCSEASLLDVPDWTRVLRYGQIACDQYKAFSGGLSNQHSIKWVVMYRWKSGGCNAVLPGHCQLLIVCIEQCSSEYCRVKVEVGLAHGMLDANLPDARSAEEQFVVAVVDQRRRQAEG